MINYYKILGVNNFSEFGVIRSAYLKLVKQHHPDLHPDNPESTSIFQYITEAYEVLSDSEKRRRYDTQLKGALYGIPSSPEREDPGKKRREILIRMREKALAREVSQFDALNERFPFKWRIAVSSLVLLTGIQQMYSHWYPHIQDLSKAKAIIGLVLFMYGVSWSSNLYYRYWRIRHIQNRIRTSYVKRSIILFCGLVALGFPAVGIMSKIRENYHLKHYREVITGRVSYISSFNEVNFYYEWEGQVYYAAITANSYDLLRKSDAFVLLEISSREPRIVRFVDRVKSDDYLPPSPLK